MEKLLNRSYSSQPLLNEVAHSQTIPNISLIEKFSVNDIQPELYKVNHNHFELVDKLVQSVEIAWQR